jgi:hypothetical protein
MTDVPIQSVALKLFTPHREVRDTAILLSSLPSVTSLATHGGVAKRA